jgi:hypothetical protein
MKRMFGIMVASVLLMGAVAAFAGDGCCAAGSKGKAGGQCAAGDTLAKLNLTADQQSKVDALKAECKAGGCNAAAREKMTAGMKEILTPEQYTQWTAACAQAKAGKGGACPHSLKSKEGHAESKS